MLVEQKDTYVGLLRSTVNWTQGKIRGSHGGVVEDSGLLGGGVLLGEGLSLLQKIIVPPTSPAGYCFWTASVLKMKALCCFETSQTSHPMVQHHISEHLSPLLHTNVFLAKHKYTQIFVEFFHMITKSLKMVDTQLISCKPNM